MSPWLKAPPTGATRTLTWKEKVEINVPMALSVFRDGDRSPFTVTHLVQGRVTKTVSVRRTCVHPAPKARQSKAAQLTPLGFQSEGEAVRGSRIVSTLV